MSQSKHTPGPWHYFPDIKAIKADCALAPKYHVIKHWNVCKIPTRTHDYPIPHWQYEANCHLIAAAPEMLASLKIALQTFHSLNLRGDEAVDVDLVIRDIRSVIQKAKGDL